MDNTAKIFAAAEYIRSRVTMQPKVALVLGSGLGDYTDTLEDLTATEYGTVYTIELAVDGETVQTLTYSANSYIASKCDGAQSEIVMALGRYGVSAQKLVATN